MVEIAAHRHCLRSHDDEDCPRRAFPGAWLRGYWATTVGDLDRGIYDQGCPQAQGLRSAAAGSHGPTPSEYIRAHVVVTTSVFSAEPLTCAVNALGAARVMFSVDYPFESTEQATDFIESVPLDEPTRRRVCFENTK